MIHQIICVKSGYTCSGDLHKPHSASLHSTVTGGEVGPGELPALFCHWGAPWIIAAFTQGEVIRSRVLASNGRSALKALCRLVMPSHYWTQQEARAYPLLKCRKPCR